MPTNNSKYSRLPNYLKVEFWEGNRYWSGNPLYSRETQEKMDNELNKWILKLYRQKIAKQ